MGSAVPWITEAVQIVRQCVACTNRKPKESVMDTEIREVSSTELSLAQLEAVFGGGTQTQVTMLSNIANMRHEMLKTVANNLRA
jgi:hypothetical protein